MSNKNHRAGYDAPQAKQENDDLDRWRFAADILQLLNESPFDWSARIGLFGSWGEGKTTVLSFLEEMARNRGHLVFWFNPWVARDRDHLWKLFAAALLEALDKAGVSVKGVTRARFKLFFTDRLSPYAESVERLSRMDAAAHAVTGAGLGVVRRLMRLDASHIIQIRSKLGDSRIVVLVDDLDRTDPRLVPHFLLALREVLDIPGFSFVLAFSPETIDSALSQYHPAWGKGGNFLEKILDFSFDLPRPSETQKQRLLLRAAKQNCPFVPEAELVKVVDLLPENPRRLKSLIRDLTVLKSEVARHAPTELNWVEILIAYLIKTESAPFLDRLLRGSEIDNQLGLAYHVFQKLVATGDKSANREDPLETLIDQENLEGERTQRLKTLLKALRARGSHEGGRSFRYQAQLAVHPHLITWKELDLVLDRWQTTTDPSHVAGWIEKQAERCSASVEEVGRALFEALVVFREDKLVKASEVTTVEEHAREIRLADVSLNLMKLLIAEGLSNLPPGSFRSVQSFEQMLNSAMRWAHFRENEADRDAREAEQEALVLFVSAVTETAHSYLEVLKPWGEAYREPGPFDGQEKARLRAALVGVIEPLAAQELLTLFDTPGGMATLSEGGRFQGLKYVLFRSDSALWNEPSRSKLASRLKRASLDLALQVNAIELLELLVRTAQSGNEVADPADAQQVLLKPSVASSLWKSATARPFQYRMKHGMRECRSKLLAIGVSEEDVPSPGWLSDDPA